MMRGLTSFAVAVRKPDSEIACETHPLPGHPQSHPWLRWPFVRGMYIIFESLSVGMKALRISARHCLGEDEQVSGKEIGWTMGLALVIFTAIFIVAPAAASKLGGGLIGVDGSLGQNLIEGALRIGLFLGYILAISFIPDIRRVFQYHGAEHKTIYAYENGDPLEPGVIDRYPTLHVRCGTNFLFIVMFFTIAVHFVMDLVLPPSIPIRIGARVLAVPLLAGGAYEVIRGASRNERSRLFRIASLPGLALQKITTRPPTRDQIEVAIVAMEAVMAAEGVGAAPVGGPALEARGTRESG
ncbi:MAG: DUF1385 domain-containing protein [Actinomycetota bacterium]